MKDLRDTIWVKVFHIPIESSEHNVLLRAYGGIMEAQANQSAYVMSSMREAVSG